MEKKACCIVSISPVRGEAGDAYEILTQLMFGELLRVVDINEPWCKIVTEADAYEGYIDIKHIEFLSEKEARRWSDGLTYLSEREIAITANNERQFICRGAFIPENETDFSIGKNEYSISSVTTSAFKSVVELAKDYLNTPYLWGGKSPFGIDCSGLTQTVYRIFGYNLPRDASDQFEHGTEIQFDHIEAGDLAFFENKTGKITHVGILDGKGKIIHASGHVRTDSITEQGIIHSVSGDLTHKLTKIKRL
jgi:gamma-D-glutamyl-L-lysine dipeptidyl-peptidase